MLCPLCRSELVVTGQERLETLGEHVCNPNGEPSLKDKYECLSEKCSGYDRFMWDEMGDLYFKNGWVDTKTFNFIDGNNGAIPSFARKMNVEIQKHDEDFLLCTIFGRKIYIRYHYKSNDDGDILKRWWKFEIILRDGIIYMSGFRMLLYSIRRFHSRLKWQADCSGRFKEDELVLQEWEKKDWWRRVSKWWARTYLFLAGA